MPIATAIREDPTEYIRHDQLFKELIDTFFAECLEVFFPEVHHHIDFSSIKPLSSEVFTDMIEGESRHADIVIEARLKGQNTLIIIHVEPQSSGQPHFHERMYHYFSLLYNKYRRPIVPIAVFSYDENRYERDQFTIEFPFFHVLTFNFLMLELRKMNWREYLQSNNPVAAALLSKMNFTEKERIKVRKEFLRMLMNMELNQAKTYWLNGFFETYLKLDEGEEETVMEEIKRTEDDEKLSMLPNFWEERGKMNEKREIAREMLKEGPSVEFIAKVTRLDKEKIENMKKEI
ncbi:Rpn family recombination-promoting nuclease/putative transposase [Lentibacillus sp. CBA3610]|uniref:Rpn family recombination-promoting nuclease/putative transposase n=1 Tax=Lentibacillus sp. CBA3610 TaxID=2518176 RepID=UPI001595CB0E|nr:Rpn family recombination-promoting nuclease/putative transposase [Lentibacillus sp. CBA3610]QKY70769.1 transposase [Lentibacillus sp. CBA3610]